MGGEWTMGLKVEPIGHESTHLGDERSRCHALEPYFGLERLPKAGWLGRWNAYVSLDVRSRIVFDYFRPDPGTKEDRQLTTNLMVGLSMVGAQRGVTDFFVRFYYGVNRNGQFRSEPVYFLVGIGVHVGL